MSDRPSAVNGKRSQAWGTLGACPACGQCLCFGCHPTGPCLDDEAHPGSSRGSGALSGFSAAAPGGSFDGVWMAGPPSGSTGVAGLRMRASFPADERLR
jgi:hypothetical protein